MITNFIQSYLQDEGAGTLGSDMFVSQIPAAPNNCITLYGETGLVTDYQSDYGSDWMGLLVMTRGDYSYASEKIWQVHNLITGLTDGETDDFTLTTTMIQSNPAQIENDSEGRRVYTAHYLFLVAQKTNKHRITI